MKGDDKVVSAFKNEALVASSNVMPGTMLAAEVDEMQQPGNNDKKSRKEIFTAKKVFE